MTSLGKLVFADTYSRQTDLDKSHSSVESLSLGYENLFYMPYNIIENYGSSLLTLDISHNKFGRYDDIIVYFNFCMHCKFLNFYHFQKFTFFG